MARGTIITKERFDKIKTVLDILPANTPMTNDICKALGVSPAIASRIKRTASHKDYKTDSLKRALKKPKPIAMTIPQTATNTNTYKTQYTDIAAHKRIEKLEQQLEDIDDRLSWITNHAVIETGKRWWKASN